MKKQIELVNQFQNITESKKIDLPFENINLSKLRIDLLQEELNEFKEACQNNNKVEMLDALCDLQYILLGTVITYKLDKIFERAFDLVHESNMSKFPKNKKELALTQLEYNKKGISTEYKEVKAGKFIVYRKEDGKVLKSINYFPVNLNQVL